MAIDYRIRRDKLAMADLPPPERERRFRFTRVHINALISESFLFVLGVLLMVAILTDRVNLSDHDTVLTAMFSAIVAGIAYVAKAFADKDETNGGNHNGRG